MSENTVNRKEVIQFLLKNKGIGKQALWKAFPFNSTQSLSRIFNDYHEIRKVIEEEIANQKDTIQQIPEKDKEMLKTLSELKANPTNDWITVNRVWANAEDFVKTSFEQAIQAMIEKLRKKEAPWDYNDIQAEDYNDRIKGKIALLEELKGIITKLTELDQVFQEVKKS